MLVGTAGYFVLRTSAPVVQEQVPSLVTSLASESESLSIAEQTIIKDLKITIKTDCLIFADKKDANFITYTITRKFNNTCPSDPTFAPGIPQLKIDRLSRVVLVQALDGEFKPLSSSPKQIANPTPTSPPDQTTNWKTHINTKVGYSIFYPSSYHVAFENDLFNFDEAKYEKGNPKGVKIQIQQDSQTAGLDLSNVAGQEQLIALRNADISGHLGDGLQTRITPLSLGNVKYANKVTGGPGGAFDIYYAFAKDGKSYYRILVWGAENDSQNLKNILSSFTTPDPVKPLITSISPASGAVGTVVEIRGSNLAGFEGDLIAVFKRSDGKTVELDSTAPYSSGRAGDSVNTTLIKVRAEPPCQKGQTVYGAYSGKPSSCDYFEFTPGVYNVYVNPWGKKSNEVQFTVR